MVGDLFGDFRQNFVPIHDWHIGDPEKRMSPFPAFRASTPSAPFCKGHLHLPIGEGPGHLLSRATVESSEIRTGVAIFLPIDYLVTNDPVRISVCCSSGSEVKNLHYRIPARKSIAFFPGCLTMPSAK